MKQSRLARHEGRVWRRQAVLFLLLVVAVIWGIFNWGIPALVKLAVFLGDIKSSTEKVESTDTVPPIAPQLLPLPVATFSAQIKVTGFAEAGSKVTVYINSRNAGEVVTDSQGEFLLDGVELTSGRNGIWAVAVDQAGNTSQDSTVVAVTMDDVKPELTLDSPADQTPTTKSNIEVKGRVSEPEAEVTVNNKFVVVASNGNFSTKVALEAGENKLTIKARDRAGNETIKELTVSRQE